MTPRLELSETLERLHAVLSTSTSLSAHERELLETLAGDISQLLKDETGAGHEPHSLADRLQEARSRLEESHPNLTLAIGAVAEALARLGI